MQEGLADPEHMGVGLGAGALDEGQGVERRNLRLVQQGEATGVEVLLAQGAGQHAVTGAGIDRVQDRGQTAYRLGTETAARVASCLPKTVRQ
jgi:hypothetical protein